MSCWVSNDKFENGKRVVDEDEPWIKTTIGNIEKDTEVHYDKLLEKLDPSQTVVVDSSEYLRAVVKLEENDKKRYTIAKITRDVGESVCGYRVCNIVYPYDLIASPGEAITSILDKIIQMLGNFEYFYNENGQFVFQRKRTYLDINFNNIINEHNNSIDQEIFAAPSELTPKYSYIFDGDELISSISNSPNLANLKNDYSIWGERKTGNISVPIHMRYAIDKKPFFYKAIGNEILRDELGFAYILIDEKI